MRNSLLQKLNPNQNEIREIYNKHANNYEIENIMMEKVFSKERILFRNLSGKVLEVGVGTGINLFYYDPSIDLTILDFSRKMLEIAKKNVKRFNFKFVNNIIEGNIDNLTNYFDKHSFDYVVSTCVFCSFTDPLRGLRQVKKVLKPYGYLVQIEHGLGNNSLLNLPLKILDPLTTKFGGFHLARNQLSNLTSAGFKIIDYRNVDPWGIIKTIISQPN
jgi:ubiquinone/menaquinone biosynthesis C-methylase UbiE